MGESLSSSCTDPRAAGGLGAHLGGCNVEILHQQLHVVRQAARPLQVVHVSLDGHVVQRKQAAEDDAVRLAQLLRRRRDSISSANQKNHIIKLHGASWRHLVAFRRPLFVQATASRHVSNRVDPSVDTCACTPMPVGLLSQSQKEGSLQLTGVRASHHGDVIILPTRLSGAPNWCIGYGHRA